MFKPVKSLQRGLLLIDAISQSKEGAYLKDLATVIDCSSAATYHLLQTLADSGYIQRLETPVRYLLGNKLLNLLDNQNQDRFYNTVHQKMFEIQKQFPGSTVYFSEYIGGNIAVRSRVDSDHPSQIKRSSQHILPPYLSAGSAVHLAYWPQDIREDYMQSYPFQTYGELFWGEWENFEDMLVKTQKEGYVLIPERNPLHLKLGLPVLGKGKNLLAALTIQWNQSERKGLRDKIKTLKKIAKVEGQKITDCLAGEK